MDLFARGDGAEDEGPNTPASEHGDPGRVPDRERTSPTSPEDPVRTGPTVPNEEGEAAAGPQRGGLGDPPPEWSGYYSYPSFPPPDRSTSSTGDTYRRQQAPFPASGGSADYWASAPPARRRGTRSVLVAVAVVACFALLVAGAGGGVGAALYFRNLSHPAQARGHAGRGGGAPGTSGTINLQSLATRLNPSVVDITGVKEDATGGAVEQDAGTGVVISKNGEVLTNNHVIEGDNQLQATVANGNTYPIKVLGEDPTDDLALVQAQGLSNLPAIPLRSDMAAAMGEPVAAFGNALGRGGPPSATQGRVTNLNQTITAALDGGSQRAETLSGLIEMSAQICPGDSGGILADAEGNDLGILTAASTPNNGGGYGGSPSGQQECSGDGFVIPIAHAIPIVKQIRSGRRSSRVIIGLPGFLGVEVQECTEASAQQGSCQPPSVNGAQISQLVQGGAAEQAGLPPSFIITAIGQSQVTSPNDLTNDLQQTSPGQAVQVTWNDGLGGPSQTTTVTLGTGPPA